MPRGCSVLRLTVVGISVEVPADDGEGLRSVDGDRVDIVDSRLRPLSGAALWRVSLSQGRSRLLKSGPAI